MRFFRLRRVLSLSCMKCQPFKGSSRCPAQMPARGTKGFGVLLLPCCYSKGLFPMLMPVMVLRLDGNTSWLSGGM